MWLKNIPFQKYNQYNQLIMKPIRATINDVDGTGNNNYDDFRIYWYKKYLPKN